MHQLLQRTEESSIAGEFWGEGASADRSQSLALCYPFLLVKRDSIIQCVNSSMSISFCQFLRSYNTWNLKLEWRLRNQT